MQQIEFSAVAGANVSTYRDTDVPLWEQFELALTAIKEEEPRSTERGIRYGAHTAYWVEVQVHGRDDVYGILWARRPSGEGAVVVHLGQALS